jgi:hypothetical protein
VPKSNNVKRSVLENKNTKTINTENEAAVIANEEDL